MTQWKVGDIVEVKTSRYQDSELHIGERGNVVFVVGDSSVLIEPHNKKVHFKTYHLFSDEVRLVSSSPDRIKSDGYWYKREREVLPEWVKDGAWVKNSINERLYKLEIKGDSIKVIGNNGWTLNTCKELGLPAKFELAIPAPTTYETIQINGKLYNLVPVES